MKQLFILPIALILGLAALPGSSSAQTCDDIEFTSQVTDQYADVMKACQAVVERSGKLYALLEAEIVRASSSRVTLRFKHSDGSMGPRVSLTPAGSLSILIDGRKSRLRDLTRGQEIQIYLPHDRWALASLDDVDVATPVTTTPFEAPEEEAPAQPDVAAALPSTGSPLPLVGLAGLLLLGLGVILTSARASGRARR